MRFFTWLAKFLEEKVSINLTKLQKLKDAGEKIVALTAYDATFAELESKAGVEVILVGDSLGMVIQGQKSTLSVTIDHMVYHTEAVVRGNKGAFIIADMPFMADISLEQTLENAAKLMRAGANMVKLEGETWLDEPLVALKNRGIPLCVHMGLRPQSVNVYGGYKVQGKGDAGDKLVEAAIYLAQKGAQMFVLECVPPEVGKKVAKAVSVPVIGIGAGVDTDGQILVMQDMLGLNLKGTAKFVRQFINQAGVLASLQDYVAAVKDQSFPAEEHCFI